MCGVTICPKCQSELPANAPAGVCPKCLLQAGLGESNPAVSAGVEATLPLGSISADGTPESPTVQYGAIDTAETKAGAKVRYFGEYELLTEIARGGMGVVYKARQVKLNRIVAIKMILSGRLASPEDTQRFYIEAEAAAGLDHPGIVPIFEVGEHDAQQYFSMGFIEGESLAARLSNGPLPPREAAELVRKVSEAIQYAHDRGIIHRDLKPANVLLKQSPASTGGAQDRATSTAGSPRSTLNLQPMVTDFGLAKKMVEDNNLTGTGQVLGTPSYMPPEQAAGRLSEVRETADVYSLGAILYATLTGRPPFQSDNPLDTLKQVLERDPVAPRKLNPNVPRDLETICLKSLEKSRDRRYASAELLAQELRRFLNGEPIQARPIGVPARAWRWCRRRPLVAALSFLSLVLLIAGCVGVLSQWIRAETRTRQVRGQIQVALKQGNSAVRVYAAGMSWRLDRNAEAVVPILIEILRDRSANVSTRQEAAAYLEGIGPRAKDAVPALIATIKDNDPSLARQAAQALVQIGVASDSIPALLDALATTDRYSSESIKTLSELTSLLRDRYPDIDKTIGMHIEAIRASDPGGRILADDILVRIGPQNVSAVRQLAEALQDNHADVRVWAASALIKIGPAASDAVPALTTALADKQVSVRWRAAVALGMVGKAAEKARPKLEQLRMDAEIGEAAAWAIENMRPETKP